MWLKKFECEFVEILGYHYPRAEVDLDDAMFSFPIKDINCTEMERVGFEELSPFLIEERVAKPVVFRIMYRNKRTDSGIPRYFLRRSLRDALKEYQFFNTPDENNAILTVALPERTPIVSSFTRLIGKSLDNFESFAAFMASWTNDVWGLPNLRSSKIFLKSLPLVILVRDVEFVEVGIILGRVLHLFRGWIG